MKKDDKMILKYLILISAFFFLIFAYTTYLFSITSSLFVEFTMLLAGFGGYVSLFTSLAYILSYIWNKRH